MMTRDLGDLGCVQSIAFMWSLVQDLTRPSNMPKLSENQRWLLNGMLEAGQRVSETARTLNVARSVVRKWRDRRQQPGGSLKDLERSGRPRVTSANQDASILNKVEAKRTMTAREIRQRLHRRRGQRPGQICYQTIRNRIRAYGMRSRKLRKRPGLLPRHRRDREAFARRHRWWSRRRWSNVLFTDECRVCLRWLDGRRRVWRRVNEDIGEEGIQQAEAMGGGSLMIWAVSEVTED
ncbi:uncharacterized protein [Amphiura filiformis]|uniref:uncharacterized protein n=1 Tax=Amphiura filiformis TaxID=82378 RepID=UPI003B2237E5